MMGRRLRAIAPVLMVCAQLYAADVWKVAGPPPASWQRDRVADATAHRKSKSVHLMRYAVACARAIRQPPSLCKGRVHCPVVPRMA